MTSENSSNIERAATLQLRTTRWINRIIVHCSATPEGKHFTTKDIDRWHRAKGYDCIGYHFVIYLDGSIHAGRSLDIKGAHTYKYNEGSIGICYVGGVTADGKKTPKDTRTPQQKESLLWLLRQLHAIYPKATIHGHREFAKKACPCFDVAEYKGKL